MKFLLDEMISPTVAQVLRSKGPEALALAETEVARTGFPDPGVLAWAAERGLTLVTYNARDFVPLARAWATEGRPRRHDQRGGRRTACGALAGERRVP